jgi:hypothetical protein
LATWSGTFKTRPGTMNIIILNGMKHDTYTFIDNASRALLPLKTVSQVYNTIFFGRGHPVVFIKQKTIKQFLVSARHNNTFIVFLS